MTHHYWPLKIRLIFYVFLSGLRCFLLIIVFTFLIVSFYAYIFSIWNHLDTLSKSVSFLVSWTYWIVLSLPLKGLPLFQLDRGLFLSLLSATQLLTGILEYAYMSDTIHSYDTEPKREACFFQHPSSNVGTEIISRASASAVSVEVTYFYRIYIQFLMN